MTKARLRNFIPLGDVQQASDEIDAQITGKTQQALQDAAEDAYFATQDQAILDDYEDPPNDEGVTA